ELPAWGKNVSRKISDYLDPDRETALIVPKGFCQDKAILIIAVASKLKNFKQRLLIRQTWGNTNDFNYPAFVKFHGYSVENFLQPLPEHMNLFKDYLQGRGEQMRLKVRLVFVVGRSRDKSSTIYMRREAEMHNDIIQEDFVDCFQNLTLKSVMILKHIANNCTKNAAFFLKCDDDSFVNIPNLLHYLLGGTIPLYKDTLEYYDRVTYKPTDRLNRTKNLIMGHKFCNVLPSRDVSDKSYIPSSMYPLDIYPDYISGSGYLISMDVVPTLYATALDTNFLPLEDVFITGICADIAGIERRHHPLFSPFTPKGLCSLKGSILSHRVEHWEMAWDVLVSDYNIKCQTLAPHTINWALNGAKDKC
ncbi:hypothetical protein KR067_008952, partial [Drosophila pandora]